MKDPLTEARLFLPFLSTGPRDSEGSVDRSMQILKVRLFSSKSTGGLTFFFYSSFKSLRRHDRK